MKHPSEPGARQRSNETVPDGTALGPNEVHVWSAWLDWPQAEISHFAAWLSVDERQRAQAFRFVRDRNRFVARRAALRAILGAYLDVPASGIAFVHGAHGKPELLPERNPQRLCFNTSHSQDLGAIALALDRAVGIDVERVKLLPDYEAIAHSHFSKGENIALGSVAPGERLEAFFNCWTRKEAFVKARGEGLSLPLDSFEVSVASDAPARLLSCTEAGDCERWSLRRFDPEPGFVGAVAAAGSSWLIRSSRWEPVPPSLPPGQSVGD